MEQQLRQVLIDTVNQHFVNLTHFLNSLQAANLTLKSHCFLNLDQARWWAVETINTMPMYVTPPGPPADETKAEVEVAEVAQAEDAA